MTKLGRSFYERDTQIVAFELIGNLLHFKDRGRPLSGVIVETEAYFGADDPASHAYRGVTPRNRVMFGPAGFSYVYFTYGNHHCLNFVTEREGKAGAVLIRALEPLEGMALMKKRRPHAALEGLTNGPGKLTQAFGITRAHSGLDLTSSELYVTNPDQELTRHIQVSKRIGISRAQDRLLRFSLAGSKFVSRNGSSEKRRNLPSLL